MVPARTPIVDPMTADTPIEHIDRADHFVRERLVGDRRRPGRVAEVSPALIELLRVKPRAPHPDADHRNPLGAMRGILFWSMVGAGMWAGLFTLIRDLLR